METVFILGLEGKVKSINIATTRMKTYTVLELKTQVFEKCGVEVENQRLIYISKDLETEKNGKDMTINDYGIRGGCNIMLVVRLPGGIGDE